MLIKRVYEVGPLVCAKCGGQMKVIAFIEPPQADVIGRKKGTGPFCRNGPEGASHKRVLSPFSEAHAFGDDPADDWYRQPAEGEPRERTVVDEDTFWAEL